MQRQLDTFNKLEELSNALFGGFRQSGGDESSSKVIESLRFNAVHGAVEGIIKSTIKSIDSLIPSIGPDIANQPWDDVAPNLIKNIEKNGRLVSNAVKDPKVRAALEQAIKVYGKALNEYYGIAQPVIDDLVTQFWFTMNIMAKKSARGATNAMIDTVSAAIAEIPVVGGLVDLYIAGGKWFNAVASGIMAPTTTLNGDFVRDTIYAGREAVAIGNKYSSEASSAKASLSSAMSAFGQDQANSVKTAATAQGVDMLQQANNSNYGDNAVNKATSLPKEMKGGHNPFMIGGGSKASKKKARNTSKRLLNSIHRFTKKMR